MARQDMKRILGFSAAVFLILITLFLTLSINSCKKTSPNYSGHYMVVLGPNPVFTMDIDHAVDDSYATFVLLGWGREIRGTGNIVENSMELYGDIPDIGRMILTAEFSDDEQQFSGNWIIEGMIEFQGTISGSKSAWPTFDVDNNPLPRCITRNCIELDKNTAISKFRSGMGHDYSDDFEACRSMKHYFLPKDTIDMSTVRIFSPVNGIVIGFVEEWDDKGVWKGTSIGIQPDGYQAFCIVLYHINLNSPLNPGDHVLAGQELGRSQKRDGTVSDVAVWVHVPGGNKLVSFFEIMNDTVFQLYIQRGLLSRNMAIITKEERDADPLECIGEQFVNSGNLDNWFDLD